MNNVFKIFVANLILMSVALEANAACRTIPPNGTGRTSSRVQTVNSILSPSAQYRGGDSVSRNPAATSPDNDIVYEGGPCPSGAICLETLFNTVADNSGQVVVIDKATGNVRSIHPLQVAEGSPGMPFFNRNRLTRYCQNRQSVFFQSQPPDVARAILDSCMGRLGRFTTNSEGRTNPYGYERSAVQSLGLSSRGHVVTDLESNAIVQAINHAYLTKPGQAQQTTSIIQSHKGTLSNLMSIIGDVRRGLGCEPTTALPNGRLLTALSNTNFPQSCGMYFRDQTFQANIPGSFGGRTRGSVSYDSPSARFTINASPLPANPNWRPNIPDSCAARTEGPGLEIFTCNQSNATHVLRVENGQITRVEVSGTRTESTVVRERRAGRPNDLSQRSVPYTHTCDIPAAAGRVAGATGGGGDSSVTPAGATTPEPDTNTGGGNGGAGTGVGTSQ